MFMASICFGSSSSGVNGGVVNMLNVDGNVGAYDEENLRERPLCILQFVMLYPALLLL